MTVWSISSLTVLPRPKRAYIALRCILWSLAVVLGLDGLVLVISPTHTLMAFGFPGVQITSWLSCMLRELGGIAMVLAWGLGWIARDPERRGSLINGYVALLITLALTFAISILSTPDLHAFHPFENPLWLWSKVVFRLLLAGLLFVLRPQEEVAS